MAIRLIKNIISGVAKKIKDDSYRKKKTKELDAQRNTLDSRYHTELNNNYLDSGEGKSAVSIMNQRKKLSDDALSNNAVRMGATPEAEIAKAASINQNYANAVQRLATVGTEKKEKLNKEYYNAIDEIDKEKANLKSSKRSIFSYIF